MASQRVFEYCQMRQKGGFVPFNAPLSPEPCKSNDKGALTQLATLDDLDEIITFLKVSHVGDLYYADFIAHVVTPELLHRHLEAQHIYLLKHQGHLAGLAICLIVPIFLFACPTTP